jgi:hypothetical protein
MKIQLYQSPNSTSIILKTNADAIELAQELLRCATDPRERVEDAAVMLTSIHKERDGKCVTATLSARVNAKVPSRKRKAA